VKALTKVAPYLFAAALMGAYAFWGPLYRDGDLFFHLALGDEMWRQRSLPWVDWFTYSSLGQENEMHSWLGSFLLSLSRRWGGEWGIRSLHWLLGTTTLMIAARFWKSRMAFSGIVVLFLLHREFSDLRPFLFSETFLAIQVFVLIPWLNSDRGQLGLRLCAVFGLTALWVNCHGGGLLAPLFFGALVKRDRLPIFVSAVLGAFGSPLGPLAYQNAFYLSHLALRFQVAEWVPPHPFLFENGRLRVAAQISTALLVFTAWCIFQWRNRRGFRSELVVALVCGLLFLSSKRHGLYLMLPAVWGWSELSRLTRVARSLAVLLVLVSVLTIQPWIWPSAVPMPERAVAFLKEAGLRGKVFAFPLWGGFVSDALGPAVKVGLDCRITVNKYVAWLLEKNRSSDGTVDLKRVLQSLPETDMVLFPSEIRIQEVLGDAGKIVWQNPVATLLLLNKRENEKNFQKVADYYASRQVPWNPSQGFDVAEARAAQPFWWEHQRQYFFPVWQTRGRAAEVLFEVAFYRRHGMIGTAIHTVKSAIALGVIDRTLYLSLGSLLIESGDLVAARRWESYLSELWGAEGARELKRQLRRVDPIALQ